MAFGFEETETAFKLDASKRSATEPRLTESVYVGNFDVDTDDLTWDSASTMQWSFTRKSGVDTGDESDAGDDDDGPATLDDITPGER